MSTNNSTTEANLTALSDSLSNTINNNNNEIATAQPLVVPIQPPPFIGPLVLVPREVGSTCTELVVKKARIEDVAVSPDSFQRSSKAQWVIPTFTTKRDILCLTFFTQFCGEEEPEKWQVHVYPRRFYNEEEPELDGSRPCYICVYLCLITSKLAPELLVRYKFSVLDNHGETYKRRGPWKRTFKAGIDRWGPAKFLRREELASIFGLGREDLTIQVEVKCSAKPRVLGITVPQDDLRDSLRHLMQTKAAHDVVLVSQGKEFPAHRAILCARSDVFRAMFEQHTKETRDSRVEISDVDPDTLDKLLEYTYTGDCSDLSEHATRLLAAADKYMLNRLKLMCAEALLSKFSPANITHLLELSELHCLPPIVKHKSFEVISEHVEEVLHTESWSRLAMKFPHLTSELILWMGRNLVSHAMNEDCDINTEQSASR